MNDKTKMAHYRPISLLLTFSKILGTVMFSRLKQNLQINNVLTTQQFGFRKGITIKKAVFTPIDNMLTALNQQKHIGGIFCNFCNCSSTLPLCTIHRSSICNNRGIHSMIPTIHWIHNKSKMTKNPLLCNISLQRNDNSGIHTHVLYTVLMPDDDH
jgi:hypothetical protein